MIVPIAHLVGIPDVVALVALFGVNAAMILFGWLQAAVPRQGAVAGLPVRREGLHRAEPDRHVRPGLADLRRSAGCLTTATWQGELVSERESGLR